MPTERAPSEFTLRAVVYPAPDLKDQWLAHCLDTDQIAQGDSAKEAISLLIEMMNDVVRFRVERKLAPAFVLKPAPQEVWDLVSFARPFRIYKHLASRSGVLAIDAWISRSLPH